MTLTLQILIIKTATLAGEFNLISGAFVAVSSYFSIHIKCSAADVQEDVLLQLCNTLTFYFLLH